MADILTLQWQDAAQDSVLFTLTDGKSGAASWPVNRTHWREKIQEYLEGGGVIAAEDPPPVPPTNAEIYDQTIQTQSVLKAVMLALADGTLVADGKQSEAALKTVVVAKM